MARKIAKCGAEIPNPAVKGAQAIASRYSILQPTGCTAQFCEGGRMIHSTEPRVGQNRSMSVVREEAIDFLCQLRRDGIIASDSALQRRMAEVLQEIETKSVNANGKRNGTIDKEERAGGQWYQTGEELEHGIRLAWKHSRRCIMRSQYEDLRLCDLRHICASIEMGAVLMNELRVAFNGGDILPTVFVFPPRNTSKPGPMIWNMQLLSFAGYEQDDSTILGDPLNVELTREIIELGWKPPAFRTKWDLLPLVTMAEDDSPAITEIPKDIFPLINITHSKHGLGFEKLGLKWVPAPALSRMGFDIGGVQYTATPFVGWFMDAEIGVRDLADQQRYNTLPSLIECLGWVDSIEEFDELHEAERLRLLSNAQSELNFAVHHSFLQSGVRMSDTLTASAMYCSFDDEHLRKFGFRLPADPYWLAPPQGSIIPLWHRGGSPNYQPKPLIARHVQDPIKCWKRRTPRKGQRREKLCPRSSISSTSLEENVRTIHVSYCSAGVTARKLARRTENRLKRRLKGSKQFSVAAVEPLDVLYPRKLKSTDVVLLIASSSGHGDIPSNGQEFANSLRKVTFSTGIQWAIFGNGNSTYSDSYNGAAKKLRDLLSEREANFLVPSYFSGDTALEDPPWSQLETWLKNISISLFSSPLLDNSEADESDSMPESGALSETFFETSLVSCALLSPNIRRMVLSIGNARYEGFSHAQIMTPNPNGSVERILKDLRLAGDEKIKIRSHEGTVRDMLIHFVDIQRPFTHVRWVPFLLSKDEKDTLLHAPLIESAAVFRKRIRLTLDPSSTCSALPLDRPRNYSMASSNVNEKGGVNLEFFVKCQPQGRFSAVFLSSATTGMTLRCRFTGTAMAPMIKDLSKPILAFTTGSGTAPLKYILQQRIRQLSDTSAMSRNGARGPGPVSLFVGFRAEDVRVISNALQDAIVSNLVDTLSLTPSNPSRWRAQNALFDAKFRDVIASKIRDGSSYVFVCASAQAAKGFASNLSALMGTDIKKTLGERYIEEVFEAA